MGLIRRWSAECPRCNGAGHLGSRDCEDEHPCPECDGEGDVEVVPFTTYRGAVEALEAIRDALKGREINAADAWFAYDRANDYLTALGGQ